MGAAGENGLKFVGVLFASGAGAVVAEHAEGFGFPVAPKWAHLEMKPKSALLSSISNSKFPRKKPVF